MDSVIDCNRKEGHVDALAESSGAPSPTTTTMDDAWTKKSHRESRRGGNTV